MRERLRPERGAESPSESELGVGPREHKMIEAHHVSKMYSRGVYALRDLSLRVDKGEFVFLTGPSGAGKSTLLRLLLRKDVPSEGQLVVGGRNLAELTPAAGPVLPPLGRFRVPGLQAADGQDRARERRVRAAGARAWACRSSSARRSRC